MYIEFRFRGGYKRLSEKWKYSEPAVLLRDAESLPGKKRPLLESENVEKSKSNVKVDNPNFLVKATEAGEFDKADKKSSEDAIEHMMKDGKRFRLGGSEGVWDTVTEETLASVKKATVIQRNMEKSILTSRKISDWDAHLDSGRKKKIKTPKVLDADHGTQSEWDEGENPFQKVLDERRDQGGFDFSSQKSQFTRKTKKNWKV